MPPPPPFGPGGRANRGVGGVQNPTRGHTLWCSIYKYFVTMSLSQGLRIWLPEAGSLKMNTALEYSTRLVQEGGRRCKKSTLNDLVHLTPLRIPLMNPPLISGYCSANQGSVVTEITKN